MTSEFLPEQVVAQLAAQGRSVKGVERIKVVRSEGQDEESREALEMMVALSDATKGQLTQVLAQRVKDRAFVDQRTKAASKLNRDTKRGKDHPFYTSVFGQRDAEDRVVLGPNDPDTYTKPTGPTVAPLSAELQGPHVTLFGLADSPSSCTAAMNALDTPLDNEPTVVAELVNGLNVPARWGVDAEDSQTPLQENIVQAGTNLASCLAGSRDKENSRTTQALKRLPGLALPCTFCLLDDAPLPLHIYELAVHLVALWKFPRSLSLYVPKLENEEEAAYVCALLQTAEAWLKERHPEYVTSSVRVIVVVENARAIFRVNEIADALHPYFAGASLGWHDFLASTARLFKEDSSYRIPIKADPSIVIKHVKASHELIGAIVGGRGGIPIGGMYGVLPTSNDVSSGTFQVTLRGFIKDVVTQLKRGLRGFWVARADFVRLGLALVEAWDRHVKGDPKPLRAVIQGTLTDAKMQQEVLDFVVTEDVPSLEPTDPQFPAALVVANVAESSQMANNNPEEVRYNVFQTLQYLAGWLAGNACVALPGRISGELVHIMDDLATVERSRWEVWHEVHHGRLPVETLIQIAHEELNFIRRDLSNEKKVVEVKWDATSSKWYPIALELVLKLMTDPSPPEFVTELLVPLTVSSIQAAEDPAQALEALVPGKLALQPYVRRFHYYFERCGTMSFAKQMASNAAMDGAQLAACIRAFSLEEVIEAASFHGNIGQSAATLDKMASSEQARVFQDEESVRAALRDKGNEYLAKFGVKFLISAKGKSGAEMLAKLEQRLSNTSEQELSNAREALLEITLKRVLDHPLDTLLKDLEALRQKHDVTGASICLSAKTFDGSTPRLQSICLGNRVKNAAAVTPVTLFEIASLSKTIGSAFCIEYFAARNIDLDTPANKLLEQSGSSFRLDHPTWGSKVALRHLMSHSALNMHYVNGVPLNEEMPDVLDFLRGNEKYGYPPVEVINEPGQVFKYSGGGFLVLQHLIESFEGRPVSQVLVPFLEALGVNRETLTFEYKPSGNVQVAHGYDDNGMEIPGTRKMFPSFAAGALGSSTGMMRVLHVLGEAYLNKEGCGPISHDTAAQMLHGTDKGSMEFMGCRMGVGVFIVEAGSNKFMVHQGANDGFRGVFMHCFVGPDAGSGFVVFANGDNRAMLFIAQAMQHILTVLAPEGVRTERFASTSANLDINSIPQEEIVNYGYKALVFSAFEPTLPDGIIETGPPDPLAKYNHLVGGKLLRVTNQRFARATNLMSTFLPRFDPELFCPMGKVMDSWETVRHNSDVHQAGNGVSDRAEFLLKKPAAIKYVGISTKYHFGNQAEFVRLAVKAPGAKIWTEIVPKSHLDGHAELKIALPQVYDVETLMVEIFPDGGLSRVALYDSDLPQNIAAAFEPLGKAKCIVSTEAIPATKKPLQLLYEPSEAEVRYNIEQLQVNERFDAANLRFGSSLVSVTNEHYGPAGQVFSPYMPLSMHDGFESARSRTPGHQEELVVKLGVPTVVDTLELDFTYFVNNNPREVSIQGRENNSAPWVTLVDRTPVKAFAGSTKVFKVPSDRLLKVEQLQLLVYPDGGVNRFRAFGKYTGETSAKL